MGQVGDDWAAAVDGIELVGHDGAGWHDWRG